jgi:hypothetical protein
MSGGYGRNIAKRESTGHKVAAGVGLGATAIGTGYGVRELATEIPHAFPQARITPHLKSLNAGASKLLPKVSPKGKVGLAAGLLAGDATATAVLGHHKQPVIKMDGGRQQAARGVHLRREAIAKRDFVSKGSLEYHDRQVSPVRAAGAGVGGAALLYGVPRLRKVSNIRDYALESNEPHFQAAGRFISRAQGYSRMVTEPLGAPTTRVLTRTPFTRWATKIPRPFKPAAIALAGAGTLAVATPIHRDRYRSVVGVPQRGDT